MIARTSNYVINMLIYVNLRETAVKIFCLSEVVNDFNLCIE